MFIWTRSCKGFISALLSAFLTDSQTHPTPSRNETKQNRGAISGFM